MIDEHHRITQTGAAMAQIPSSQYDEMVADNGRLLGEVARLTERLRIAEAALTEIARSASQPAARTLAASTLNALAAAE